jgi:hypothetical protein
MGDDFIKNLQQSLETGDAQSEAAKYLNEIDKKADEIKGDVSEKIDKRIKESGEKVELDEDEREEAQQELVEVMAAQKDNDEKLKCLAQIEAQNARMRRIKDEFSSVKEKFSKKVKEIYEYKITLMVDFEQKYGAKADEVYDFGDEPSTDLEKYDTQY